MTTIEKLIEIYEQAEKRLYEILKKKGVYASAAVYERSLLRQVDEELRKLRQSSASAVNALVEENYETGLQELTESLSAIDDNKTYDMFSKLNRRQVEIIARNTNGDFNKAIGIIGRRTKDAVRSATLDAEGEKIGTGQTIREMRKNLENKLLQQNITAVTYKNGAEMPLKKYVEMAARTTTAEAQNRSQLVQGKEWGYDLVRMTSHSPTCAICAMYQGRVYATTKEAANGKYKTKDGKILTFPYLYDTAFVSGYDTLHPNCRHRLSIFPPDAYTGEELSDFSGKSTQPFEDNRSDTERKAYAQEQAEKRRKNEQYKQYERLKQVLPNDAPKSYAGFVRMKQTNSQRYQELMSDYRKIMRVANQRESGIISLNDSGSIYHIVTDEAIKNVPKVDIFNNDELNRRYQQANMNLLREVQAKGVGTEISAVYNENMEQIGTYLVGENGKTKIDNPDVPYHAFHNHPSGETFSPEDLLRLISRDNMLSLTATGNNSKLYYMGKTKNSDSESYNDFISDEMDKIYFLGRYSYNDLRNKNKKITFQKNEIDVLYEQIVEFGERCAKGGEQYGFQYIVK